LEELDWDGFRSKYGDISRMDRILKAEGKSPDEYKVSKQADALMTFYNLDSDEVTAILNGVGCSTKDGLLSRNFYYYLNRTSHGSTLSSLVHSYLASLIGDRKLSWQLYLEALRSDYEDIQDGTTKEGIHTGVMAGTARLTLRAYAGLKLDGDRVRIAPCLPETWRQMSFNFQFKGDGYYFALTPEKVKVKVDSPSKSRIEILVGDRQVAVGNLEWVTFELEKGEKLEC
ncbi:MAG: glycoside hydrolase family 65 protein, partial [Anaerolineales bacterium]|nr:glycoside hydrolase family 65 protein [Anaerolineales bacterium]